MYGNVMCSSEGTSCGALRILSAVQRVAGRLGL